MNYVLNLFSIIFQSEFLFTAAKLFSFLTVTVYRTKFGIDCYEGINKEKSVSVVEINISCGVLLTPYATVSIPPVSKCMRDTYSCAAPCCPCPGEQAVAKERESLS